MTHLSKAKLFIKNEIARLKNPSLTRDDALRKRDFFDLIMLIQLRSKLKLYKEVPKN
jgi:hypothetical protein